MTCAQECHGLRSNSSDRIAADFAPEPALLTPETRPPILRSRSVLLEYGVASNMLGFAGGMLRAKGPVQSSGIIECAPALRQVALVEKEADGVLPEAKVLNGLAIGALYALISVGYNMVYGILELINFAHGDVYMFGTFDSSRADVAQSSFSDSRPACVHVRRAHCPTDRTSGLPPCSSSAQGGARTLSAVAAALILRNIALRSGVSKPSPSHKHCPMS